MARVLDLREGAPVIVRDRRFVVEGEPVQMATSYLPAELVRDTAIAQPDTGPGRREHIPDDRGGVVLGSRTDHRTLGPGTGRAVLATSPGVRRLLLSHNIVGTTVNVAGSRTVLALAR